jgi:3-oxoacyl-[acyl-carrier protein] reductase
MSDAYLNFVNSGIGHRLAAMLGLPQPVNLLRHQLGQPVVSGHVLLAAGPDPELLGTLAQACASIGADTLAHRSAPGWTALANRCGSITGPWACGSEPGPAVQGVLIDASGLTQVRQGLQLHAVMHEVARSIRTCGRVLVLSRPESSAQDPEQAAVRRALLGWVKSLAKELKRGITVQLLQVSAQAEDRIEGALRFFMSPRSAYVSGQSIRLDPDAAATPVQWTTPLAGRHIMVTGAARGIGQAIAETLARDGARVVCVDVPEAQAPLQDLAQRIGGQALALNITDPEAAQQVVTAALQAGGWEGVVHNAGITRDKTTARMPDHLWQAVVDVNLQAQLQINQALLNAGALKDRARLVCVSSISGIAGNVGQTNYAFSKAGVIGMMQGLATELPAGMAINAVAPGFIETQMTAQIPLAIREAGRRMNALGQGGLPIDVAEAIAWLISPAAQGINGQNLRVCGLSLLGA